ncbi:MAG: GspH/FimT family pseudopilin [Aeromonas sp.]
MRLPATGFTLIELLVAIAIAAIMLTIGVPSFQRQQLEQQVQAQREAMLNSLTTARVASQRFAVQANVCPSADGTQCGTDWRQGWIVYLDSNNDRLLTPGEQILQVHQYRSKANIQTTATQFVFRPNGMTVSANINICADQVTELHRAIAINPLGAITSSGSSDANCTTP